MVQAYLGHSSQLHCVEEMRLVGGKGDGMRLIQVRNASGLEFTVSADRCADLSRVIFKGDNMGYFSPCGYVSPNYYDRRGAGFMRSFTAGFLTTCGLESVGPNCSDEGEEMPMHGSISNMPCDRIWWEDTEDSILIRALVRDANFGERKLELNRTITCGKFENTIEITDKVRNYGSKVSPLMLMYHMNMGYPLLSENTTIDISSAVVLPRDEEAKCGLTSWTKMEPPQINYAEQCFFHTFEKNGKASVFNPDIGKGLDINFDIGQLPYFTQWKKMNVHEYVLGLEPGNCIPTGRAVARQQGKLSLILPGEEQIFKIKVHFFTDIAR